MVLRRHYTTLLLVNKSSKNDHALRVLWIDRIQLTTITSGSFFALLLFSDHIVLKSFRFMNRIELLLVNTRHKLLDSTIFCKTLTIVSCTKHFFQAFRLQTCSIAMKTVKQLISIQSYIWTAIKELVRYRLGQYQIGDNEAGDSHRN